MMLFFYVLAVSIFVVGVVYMIVEAVNEHKDD